MNTSARTFRPPGRQRGLGLVEIMIAMTLGLIVTGAIVQIYVTTKRQTDMQGSLTARQENARFAAQTIQWDAQMTGYRGCLKDRPTPPGSTALADGGREVVNTLNSATDFTGNYSEHVEGYEAGEALPAEVTDARPAGITAGTDVVTLRTVNTSGGITLVENMARSWDPLKTVPDIDPEPFAPGDILLVADCSGAAIFQVTAFDAATGTIEHTTAATGIDPGNATNDLGNKFTSGSMFFGMRNTTYFISDSENGTGPALWRRNGLAPAEELAEGIENLQVLYGIDTNNDEIPDDYLEADAIADWNRVYSMQFALLVAGVERVAEPDARTFDLLGEVVGPFTDGRLRRILTFTVALRNRVV